MDPIPIAAGMAIWLVTAVAYVAYRARLRSSRFTGGTVIDIVERIIPAGEGTAWHPTVRYRTLDGGVAEFRSGWGMERQRWHVGEAVSVKVYDGRPEIYDPRLVRVWVAAGIVFGFVVTTGPFIRFPGSLNFLRIGPHDTFEAHHHAGEQRAYRQDMKRERFTVAEASVNRRQPPEPRG